MEKLPPKPRRNKNVTKEELLKMDKNELVNKIIQLEAHNFQLKNILSKNLPDSTVSQENPRNKPFDFSKSHFRRVLLHIFYFGWDYQGLAVQENSNQTIEHHIFYALTKTCLIESRETSQYHRCGRTDKGVSAFGQVISISLRSKHPPATQNNPDSISTELQYCKLINRLLPKEIRAVAWMPIPDDMQEYSARFDCKKRQYKYYFPRSSLSIQSMRSACARLVGSNDYRHLCKMDVGNGVTEFIRHVVAADIVPVDASDTEEPTSMFYLKIEGNAFLWHQIRCIMGVLLLIGQGDELPGVITELLDVEKNQRKPQYNMALDTPLNLFKCTYELEGTSKWVYDDEELKLLIAHLQGEWTIHNVKSTMIKDALQHLEVEYAKCVSEKVNPETNEREQGRVMSYTDCLLQGVKAKVYTPIMERETCSSLEERIEYYRKRRKIEANDETM